MIVLNRTLDSKRNLRAFAEKLNVVEETGTVEKVLESHESARAGGLVATAYVVLDSRPFARTRITGLTNALARQIAGLKEGQKFILNGQLQMRGYIAVETLKVTSDSTGVEQL